MRRLGFLHGFCVGIGIVGVQAIIGAGMGCWAGDRIQSHIERSIQRVQRGRPAGSVAPGAELRFQISESRRREAT